MSTKRCPRCGQDKSVEEFHKTKRGATLSYCRPCHREYCAQQQRERRLVVLRHYGGDPPRCACCGEAHIEFLQVEHRNRSGGAHREEIGTQPVAQWIIKHGFPPWFEVLCANCNTAKGHYGYCPHEGR